MTKVLVKKFAFLLVGYHGYALKSLKFALFQTLVHFIMRYQVQSYVTVLKCMQLAGVYFGDKFNRVVGRSQ